MLSPVALIRGALSRVSDIQCQPCRPGVRGLGRSVTDVSWASSSPHDSPVEGRRGGAWCSAVADDAGVAVDYATPAVQSKPYSVRRWRAS